MKNNRMKKLLAVLLSAAMITIQSGTALATESDVTVSTDRIETVSEPEAEEPIQDAGEDEGSADAVEKKTSFDDIEETASADFAGETEISFKLNGMPEGYTLSEKQIEGKKRITENEVISQMGQLEPGVDYVEDEVIFSCDDPEYAKVVARAYNGTLKSCSLGVAVIKLDTDRITAKEAVTAGADISTTLPPVDLNTKVYLTDPVEYSFAETAENTPAAEIFANKRGELEGRNWEYWTQTIGFNDPALDPAYIYPGSEEEGKDIKGYQWMHDAVESYRAWGVTKGEGVTVAVIDTGVYSGHEELNAEGKVDISAYSVEPFNSMVDNSGHGTHVAGIIAAQANNGKGGTGIAPDAKILAVPIFFEDGSYASSTLIRGINYVTNNGKPLAQIINMSLGGPKYSNTEEEAVQKALKAGITVCAAMGNDSASCIKYPAGYDGVIAVASLDESRQKSDFSSFGSWADVGAPGTLIFSSWNGHSEDNLSENKTYYGSWNGTSMAAPVTAGVCALYLSAYKNARGEFPKPEDVEKALKKTATKVSSPYEIGAGMVNAAKMLSLIENTGEPEIIVPKDLSENSVITLSDKNAAGKTLGFVYTVNGKKPAVKNGEVTEGFFVETSGETPGKYDLSVSELISSGIRADESVKLQVLRITGIGTATDTASCDIQIPGTSVSYKVEGPSVVAKGRSAAYSLYPGFKKGKVSWSLESGAPSGVRINKKTGKVSIGKSASGEFTVVGEAEGRKGTLAVKIVDPATRVTLKASGTVSGVNIPVENRKTGNIVSARIYTVNIKETKDFNEKTLILTGTADNGTEVVFTSSKPSVATVDQKGIVTGHRPGTVKITCKAADGSGKKAVVTVKVIIPASRLGMFAANAQQAVGYGKKMTLRPVLGTAYGEPTIKKVQWKSVAVRGFNSLEDYVDVTSDAKKYVKIKNGKLSVDKRMKNLGSYPFYVITVGISSTDGTGLSAYQNYITFPATTVMQSCSDNKPIYFEPGYAPNDEEGIPAIFRGDLGLSFSRATETDKEKHNGYTIDTEITSSNPDVASVYCMAMGYDDNYIYYYCVITTLKEGTADITIKATDGSGKKAKQRIIVKKTESTK